MNRPSITLIAVALTALFAAVAPVQAQVKRPNIVIILGDDLGFADLGAFGSEIKTPNIDSLAKEGVRFANFYTHASCSPTRSVPAHNAPQPYICIVLSGELEVAASDGEARRFKPGAMLFCNDLTGKGHVTRAITDSTAAFVNRAKA
jgi:Sulfatase